MARARKWLVATIAILVRCRSPCWIRSKKARTVGERRRAWGKAEAGFELNGQHEAVVDRLIATDDVRGLLRLTDAMVGRRFRDPFIRLERNALRAIADQGNAEAILRHAKDCLAAASLVPEGGIYDKYRGQCVLFAGLLAAESRALEAKQGVKPSGSTATRQFAVGCCDWLLENGSEDATGELSAFRAWCLMADGQLDAALAQVNKALALRKDDPEVAYECACLMSRMDMTDKALANLLTAIKLGYTDIPHVKRDPDFENLRRKQVAGFARAVEV